MRTAFVDKVAVLSLIAFALVGCVGTTPRPEVAPACAETIGLSAQLSNLQVGEQHVVFSVFPQRASSSAVPEGPEPQLRVRFFRVISQSPELNQPGQELRLYAPEVPPVAHARPAPMPTPFGVAKAYGYDVAVLLDKPGAWGAEVFVRTAWQIAPTMTTLLFQVTSANAKPASADRVRRDRFVSWGSCGGVRFQAPG